MPKNPVTNLVEGLLTEGEVPPRFTNIDELRKPTDFPKSAPKVDFTPEQKAYLDTLPYFEVDGDDLLSVDLPPGTIRAVVRDFNTRIPWLIDTSGYEYIRYATSVNGYLP